MNNLVAMVTERLLPRFALGMIAVLLLVLFSGCTTQPTGSYNDRALESVEKAKAGCPDYLAGKGARDVNMDALCSEEKTATVRDTSQKGAEPTATVAAGDLPIAWDALQVHYTAAKGEIKSDYIEEVAYGSMGDSLLIGVKMNAGKANGEAELRLRQKNNLPTSKRIDIVVNGTAYLVGDDTTDKEHASGIKYYHSGSAIVVEIQNIIHELKNEFDKDSYVLGVDGNDAAKGKAMEYVLIDKKIFKN